MKKSVLMFSAIALVLLFGSIYIIIPSTLTVSSVRYVKAYQNTIIKLITDQQKMNEWFQSFAAKHDSSYEYQGFDYHVSTILSSVTEIKISSGQLNADSKLLSLSIYLDSSAIQWSTVIHTSYNPFTRIQQYTTAEKLKQSMTGVIDRLKLYIENTTNMYGIAVKEIQLKDSILVTSKIKTAGYPGVTAIYKEVERLQQYAAQQGASTTNAPMLYVKKLDATNYEAMIGLPINKLVTETAEIRIKRMPYGGNMFVADIAGGPATIQKGFESLTTFLFDSKRVSPAIPFELMITDRSKETDTTKWLTRLYYPIM
ncbi:MAG: GyrI-like domain-containing protein [Bacteroidota bacterium]|nr:GyrI-like domain-containing protein [Bacteroidota bacterium]